MSPARRRALAGLVARTMFDNVEYRSADANGWATSCQDSRFEHASAFDENGSTPTKEAKVATRMQDGSELADALLKRIGEMVGDRAKVSTVFGEPVEREGITVIPVAKARFGFGGGGGAGPREGGDGSGGGGGGGGALVTPVGYIELRGDAAQFRRISTPVDVLALVAAASLAALALRRLVG